MAQRPQDAVRRPFVTLEDADREWVISLFASFAGERGDLEAFLASKVEWETRRRQGASEDRCPS